MRPDDVFVTNDPYRGGVHANDVMLCRPVFVDGSVRYFAASLIHVLDLGGAAHGGINAQAMETFEEGVQIPPMHWIRAGVRNEDLARLVALNSRSPAETVGDIDALAAGTLVAARRVEAMIDEHGAQQFDRVVERYLDQTEALTRAGIDRIPDGRYRGHAVIDDDGLNPGRSYDIHVEVRVRGDSIELDFEGTSPQVRAPDQLERITGPRRRDLRRALLPGSGNTHERGMLPARDRPLPTRVAARPRAAEPVRRPHDGGVRGRRRDHRRARAGRPRPHDRGFRHPPRGIRSRASARATGSTTRSTSAASARPSGTTASTPPASTSASAATRSPRSSRSRVAAVSGSRRSRSSPTRAAPAGGAAARASARPSASSRTRSSACVPTASGRPRPDGSAAGPHGRARSCAVTPDGRRTSIPSKAVNVRFEAGDAFVVETSGGGGIGDPRDRPDSEVRRDVAVGAVSTEAAETVYGVRL